MFVGKHRAAEFDPGAEPAKTRHRVVLLDGIYHRPDPGGDLPEIHPRRGNGRKAEFRPVFHEVIDMGGLEQGLARHAAVVETIAAQRCFLFHQQGLGPELRRAGGHREPCGAAADDAEVVLIVGHAVFSPSCRVYASVGLRICCFHSRMCRSINTASSTACALYKYTALFCRCAKTKPTGSATAVPQKQERR